MVLLKQTSPYCWKRSNADRDAAFEEIVAHHIDLPRQITDWNTWSRLEHDRLGVRRTEEETEVPISRPVDITRTLYMYS
jgi:hypothetical protein